MEYKKCPICNSPSDNEATNTFSTNCNCLRCGIFEISKSGKIELFKQKDSGKYDDEKKANISGWISENQGSDIILDAEKIKYLMTLKTPTVSEKATFILKYLAKQFPVAGMELILPFKTLRNLFIISNDDNSTKWYLDSKLLPMLALGRITNIEEFQFIWMQYLIKEKRFISSTSNQITPAGWAYLESLRQPNPDSKKAFVAMWFTDEMKEICEKYIKPAAEKAGGYKAEPITEKDYNGDINDAIIGEIRNSKFIIAGFTGNRGGVYYEAGFAYGLHIPVIYSCREDWFNQFVKQSIKIKDSKGIEKVKKFNIFSQIHFDVNHHNFIVWKNEKDLYDQLLKRIKATIT